MEVDIIWFGRFYAQIFKNDPVQLAGRKISYYTSEERPQSNASDKKKLRNCKNPEKNESFIR